MSKVGVAYTSVDLRGWPIQSPISTPVLSRFTCRATKSGAPIDSGVEASPPRLRKIADAAVRIRFALVDRIGRERIGSRKGHLLHEPWVVSPTW